MQFAEKPERAAFRKFLEHGPCEWPDCRELAADELEDSHRRYCRRHLRAVEQNRFELAVAGAMEIFSKEWIICRDEEGSFCFSAEHGASARPGK